MKKIKFILAVTSIILPFRLRRLFLQLFLGYKIHPTSKIGFAFVFPRELILEADSSIGHLTVCKGMDLIHLKESASIGRLNWIYGFPSISSKFYSHQIDRKSELILKEHSAITHRHIIDCTNSIIIGSFSIIAGYRSQLLTHSIDLIKALQSSKSISIGNYCFVGTNSCILGGSVLPDFSILGAKSLLNDTFSDVYTLYAGVIAKPIRSLPRDLAYFTRRRGYIN